MISVVPGAWAISGLWGNPPPATHLPIPENHRIIDVYNTNQLISAVNNLADNLTIRINLGNYHANTLVIDGVANVAVCVWINNEFEWCFNSWQSHGQGTRLGQYLRVY